MQNSQICVLQFFTATHDTYIRITYDVNIILRSSLPGIYICDPIANPLRGLPPVRTIILILIPYT